MGAFERSETFPSSRRRRDLLPQQPSIVLGRPGDDFLARGEAELGEDVADVGLDGSLADREVVGDVAVGEMTGQERGHFAFAPG